MGYTPMPPDISLLLRYLHQKLGEMLNRQYARKTIYRHMNKPMAAVGGRDKPGGRVGRPSKGTKRNLLML